LKTKFSENKSGTERGDRSDIIGRHITKEWFVVRVQKGDYDGCKCVCVAGSRQVFLQLGGWAGDNGNFHKK
jgi:hypothetical protein